MWTQFWDMHSGGNQKEKFDKIYIEAPREEAIAVFYSRFGHNPERVSCTCCGEDYTIHRGETLAEITAFHRGCDSLVRDRPHPEKGWEDRYVEIGESVIVPDGFNLRKGTGKKTTLEQYVKKPGVLVIYADEIKNHERTVRVPEQGYVWVE